MKRSLKDTRREVVITIDNRDRADPSVIESDLPWTANATVDGEHVLVGAELGRTVEQALKLIGQALEHSGDLDDVVPPIPSWNDDGSLPRLVRAAAESWGEVSSMPARCVETDFAYGQALLIWHSCDIRLHEGEEPLDLDDALARIWDWIVDEKRRRG